MDSFKLDEILSLPNYRDQFFSEYDGKQPIVLYGCGNRCIDAIQMFREHGFPPVAICDSDPLKQGKMYQDFPIYSLNEMLKKYSDFYIFISAPLYAEEIKNILKCKLPRDKILFWGNFSEQKDMKNYLKNNEDFLIDFYSNLNDIISKKSLINMIKGRITCNNEYYKEIYTPNQYFPDGVITLSNHETFVDAGSFTGDTISEFIFRVNGKYNKVVAFEPNPKCFRLLSQIQDRYENLLVVNKGAYSKRSQLRFDNTESISINQRSKISEKGDQVIEVDKIDNYVRDDNVTMIKMDIEGSELAALKGAAETICKSKPKLAICIYHKYQDIIDIPRFICTLNMNYRFYIRHHSYYQSETVLYAI